MPKMYLRQPAALDTSGFTYNACGQNIFAEMN